MHLGMVWWDNKDALYLKVHFSFKTSEGARYSSRGSIIREDTNYSMFAYLK